MLKGRELTEKLNWILNGDPILGSQSFSPNIIHLSRGYGNGKRTIAIVLLDNGFLRNDPLCI